MEPILVFLPGLGADRRLFDNQTAAFPNSYAVDWIDPLPKETLEEYAVRLTAAIRTELDKCPPSPIIVCGLSLGGMMAPYIARELNASGCILLCTIRGSKEFPRRYYLDWLFMRCCPVLRLVRLSIAQVRARLLLLCSCLPRRQFIISDVLRQFAEFPTRHLVGLSRMMFDWAYRRRSPEEIVVPDEKIPTLHIHGTRDLLLPIRLTNPDVRLNGGHLLVLSHPAEVNGAIRKFLDEHFPPEG